MSANYPVTKSVLGTTTNDNAAAGYVGEVISAALASGSATALTTGVFKDITSISLTAGDWDVSGIIGFAPAATTSITLLAGGVSLTSATLDSELRALQVARPAFVPGAGGNNSMSLPNMRISLASTTTVYLPAGAVFTVSTLGAFGSIIARRAR